MPMKIKDLQKRIFLLLAITVCVISTVWAWFYIAKNADVGGISFSTVNMFSTQIKVNDSEFDDRQNVSINVKDVQELSGLGYVKRVEGVDVLQLWKPEKNPFTGEPITNSDGSWKLTEDTLVANQDFLEFEVTVKTNVPGELFLSNESQIRPVDTTKRISGFGNFSEDYIASAVRMSVVVVETSSNEGNVETTEHLQFIWAPNKDQELVAPRDAQGNPKEAATTGWTFIPSGGAEQSYFYYDGVAIKQVSSDELNHKIVIDETESFVFYDVIPEGGAYIGDIVANEDGSAYCHLRIRIWIEGTDREAKSALTGGHFTISLVFGSRSEIQEETNNGANS